MRPRIPDHMKGIKISHSYEDYVQFEASFSDLSRDERLPDSRLKRVDELKAESLKTLEALKQKPPVRIPELKTKEETAGGALAAEKKRGKEWVANFFHM